MKKLLSVVLALAVVLSCMTVCLTANAADAAAAKIDIAAGAPGYVVMGTLTKETGPFAGLKDSDFVNGFAEVEMVITNATDGSAEICMADNWGTYLFPVGTTFTWSGSKVNYSNTMYGDTRFTVAAGATTVVTFKVPKVCDLINENGEKTTVNANLSYKNIGLRINVKTTAAGAIYFAAPAKQAVTNSFAAYAKDDGAAIGAAAEMPADMKTKIDDMTKTFAAGVLTTANANGYAITKTGIFKGVDFGSKDVKEVSFGAYLDAAGAETVLTTFQVCFEWGSSIYNGVFDTDKWNTAVWNKAWNKLNPGKTQKTVDKYIEDGNHPDALGGTQASLNIKAGEGTTFTLNVPKQGSIVNFQTRYMVVENEATKKALPTATFADGVTYLESAGSLPAALKDLEAGKDYTEYRWVTSNTTNAYTDFGLRINGIKEKDAKVIIVCLSDSSVNTNIARAVSFTGFGAISGLDDKAALKTATSDAFMKLLEGPAPTAVPLDPTTKPTAKPAATPIVKDAFEVKGSALSLGQLVHANAGITTLPDGNTTIAYEVKNPNAYDIVVSLMMQTGKKGENECGNDGWNFIVDGDGKNLNEKFVTVKAGETKKITFTFPVKDNKVKCHLCKGEHDVSSLWLRFDAYKASGTKNEETGAMAYDKLTDGTFIVLTTGNATLDGYLAKLTAGNAAIMTATTVEIPVKTGDMMPVALIACVAVAAASLVVVSKKRKED